MWVEHLGDKPVNWIKTADVQEYFVWLRTEYEPRRIGGGSDPVVGRHGKCLGANNQNAFRPIQAADRVPSAPRS